jgi:hypothetical protein
VDVPLLEEPLLEDPPFEDPPFDEPPFDEPPFEDGVLDDVPEVDEDPASDLPDDSDFVPLVAPSPAADPERESVR